MAEDGVIALVPARANSRGIPLKNFKPIAGGLSCADRALLCARRADIPAYNVYLSTDYEYPDEPSHPDIAFRIMKRPPELATDECGMVAVVQHALEQIPGQPEQIIVLLQPTQPLRTPAHILSAITRLEESGADSVVSVVELPPTHAPEMVLALYGGRLRPFLSGYSSMTWTHNFPVTRQEAQPAYMRDGTVYAFRRSTVTTYGNIYGEIVRPLIIDPAETCPLDTEADWREAERRLREREAR